MSRTVEKLRLRLSQRRHVSKKLRKQLRRAHNRILDLVSDFATYKRHFTTAASSQQPKEEMPVFIRDLLKAHREGHLKGRQGLVDLLGGMAQRLVSKGRGKGMRRTLNENAFWLSLRNMAGPRVFEFTSALLLGPHERTVRRLLEKEDKVQLGAGEGIIGDRMRLVKEVMSSYGIPAETPFIVAEDGTALRRMLELQDKKTRVVVYGLDGGPREYESVDEFTDDMKGKEASFATTAYVHILVPILRHAPTLPVIVQTNKNSFSSSDVMRWWRELWVAAAATGINLVGHTADGDARFRSASLHLMLREGSRTADDGKKDITHGHFLLRQLRIPWVEGYNKHVTALSDYMHLIWRWRVLFLRANRPMFFGESMLGKEMVTERTWREFDVAPGDLDPKDKQRWDGCLNLVQIDRKSGKVSLS